MNKKQKALHEFLKTAKQNHGAKIVQIILFVSYARGEATKESDIDIQTAVDVTLDNLIDISSPSAHEIRRLYICACDYSQAPQLS